MSLPLSVSVSIFTRMGWRDALYLFALPLPFSFLPEENIADLKLRVPIIVRANADMFVAKERSTEVVGAGAGDGRGGGEGVGACAGEEGKASSTGGDEAVFEGAVDDAAVNLLLFFGLEH